MWISEWRGKDTHPEVEGLYQISLHGSPHWSWWNGEVWCGMIRLSYYKQRTPTAEDRILKNQNYPWRGLIHDKEQRRKNATRVKKT